MSQNIAPTPSQNKGPSLINERLKKATNKKNTITLLNRMNIFEYTEQTYTTSDYSGL